MDTRATESEIQEELEKKLLHPTAEPICLPLSFLKSITRGFHDEEELGRGGYGVVYKGHLLCGLIVAVKKIHNIHLVEDDIRLFQREVTSLMEIKHQNVVQLLGYCAESRWEMVKLPNGKYCPAQIAERIFCFEYMCNKGLDNHLSDESSGLEWKMRYNIIKGICSGLNFLHACNIIHLDLKPQNILMDSSMVPKIADFGLSRLLGEQNYQTITRSPAGSLGYMAPEYITQGLISQKADIFSLGVIIIEILTGHRDYPLYPQSTKADFEAFTEKVLGNWTNRFERSSKCSYTAVEVHSTQQVKQCIDIALKCVNPDKMKRPNALNIIEILKEAEASYGKHLPVDHQMGSQEGVLPQDVWREDELLALYRSAMTDNTPPARIIEDMWNEQTSGTAVDMVKSVVAPPQSQDGAQCNEGSLATLCYKGARNASFWVAHKALASLEDNMLKDWAATINLGPSVEALKQELLSVKVILESSLGKVIHNLVLERSLMMLQDLVYDSEDVLDEMEYFRIQGDMLDASQHAEGCTHNLDLNVLPSVHDEPPKLKFDRDNASRRIQHIVEQMQLIEQKVSSAIKLLGSDWSTAPNIAQNHPITICESIEPKLYGRELMMKSIIDDITKGKYSHDILTVIPIVGPGGIGKTTLAQHIYHNGEVQEHFDVRVWTCVSLNFNVNKLIEEIQRYIPKVDGEGDNDTASELIGKRLKNNRLLLVLDDIWDCSDEDEWKRLLVPFRKSQVQGNIIIVTTRFPAQAQIMVRKHNQSIYLHGIENKELEELFLEIVFGDDDQSRKDHVFLLETGFKIVDKLKGSPLGAKTVGRLLKTKLDLDHWKRVLQSKEWENSDTKNDIMPALKLSFAYLPSQLQQCFSYCALFPQDYKFKREELINFWIGLEVLHSSHGENKRVEDIGLSHLTDLVNYGLLEKIEGKDGSTCYNIHDLLHELARKVSSHECLVIDSSQLQVMSLEVLPSIRHLSINIEEASVKDRFILKNCVEDFNTLLTRLKVEKLRTLMLFGEHHDCFVKAFADLFREAKALRLVFLSGASYHVKDLLHNFYYLIHLRYLRIESSSLYKIRFPTKISRFYHMKVLDAEHCDIIGDWLPRDISNLVKLRHLLVKHDYLHSCIVDVGKLKSLQELRRFVVKTDDQGFELRQIGYLEELCGSLRIDNLENVQPEEADEANLVLKSRIYELILCWSIGRSTNYSRVQEHVLERLKPSSYLQKLSIKGHRGGTCPSWLGANLSIEGLRSLCLDGVAWKTYPPIGELWLDDDVPPKEISGNILDKRFGNLERLEIRNSKCLKKWVVHAPCQLFPSLRVLVIEDCSNLVELSFSHSACCQQEKGAYANLFPRLLHLEIRDCPKLSSFPPVPWAEAFSYVVISGIGSSCIDRLHCSELPNELSIRAMDTPDNTWWDVLDFHNLSKLEELNTYNCQALPLRHLQMLSSLRFLQISCSSNAFAFVEADSHIQYQFPVESLDIRHWSGSGKELTQLLTYFPKLSDLYLFNCKKVTELGAMETPGPSSAVNKVEQRRRRRRWDARAKDDVIIASEEAERGLLLLPPQLQKLKVMRCPELSLRPDPHGDSNQDGRTWGGRGGGLLGLSSLRWLFIINCPKLLSAYSSSSFSSCFPSSLECLQVLGVVGTEASLPLSNLTSLATLAIKECKDLRGEGLLSLLTQGHLTKLLVIRTPNFFVDSEPPWVHEQERPSRSSKLQELEIEEVEVAGFTAAPIRHSLIFSTLTKLGIYEDNKVESFTEEQEALLFVNSLEEIEFRLCHNLKSLPERVHRLPNLKSLQIWRCEAIQMLPRYGLPSSLEELNISGCPKIQSLPKNCLPDSLQKIRIRECPAIRSLPKVDDLPSSLRELDVRDSSNSEELRNQCRTFINIIPIVKA